MKWVEIVTRLALLIYRFSAARNDLMFFNTKIEISMERRRDEWSRFELVLLAMDVVVYVSTRTVLYRILCEKNPIMCLLYKV